MATAGWRARWAIFFSPAPTIVRSRFYSLSSQIQRERKAYYAILERTQKGTLDVTEWLVWFLNAVSRALWQAHAALDTVFVRARFWQRWGGTSLNPRQTRILTRMLDGFEGNLTSSKYASICKCSPDTALRDLNELVAAGIVQRSPAGGRSTAYELAAAPRHV
jgi:Fic family protein